MQIADAPSPAVRPRLLVHRWMPGMQIISMHALVMIAVSWSGSMTFFRKPVPTFGIML
jgi:hypothetical protein